MPSLNWIGRQAVEEHHRKVPFHLLRCNGALSVGDASEGSGNLLIQGDNLLALKALLPYYAGQVKCIYIDPPYNTGNENWVYNDNVNSPQMRVVRAGGGRRKRGPEPPRQVAVHDVPAPGLAAPNVAPRRRDFCEY